MLTNLEVARNYLQAIERGISPAEFFAPGMTMEQFPNRVYPKGLRAGIAEMADGFERGKKLFSSQSYEIKNAVVEGDSVALEVFWCGVLAVPLGTLVPGNEMRAYSAMFLHFRDGKIVTQRNYDCFEPW